MFSFLMSLGMFNVCFVFASTAAYAESLVVARYPVIDHQRLIKSMSIFARYLETATGEKVLVDIPKDYETFYKNSKQGKYDVIMSPSHFAISLIDKGLYYPVFIPKGDTVTAAVFTTKDSVISSIKELENITIALPDPNALVSHVVTSELAKLNLLQENHYKVLSKTGHDNVVISVMSGEAQVGIVSKAILDIMPASSREKIKVIAEYPDLIADFMLVNEKSKALPHSPSTLKLFKDLTQSKQYSKNRITWSEKHKFSIEKPSEELLNAARKYKYD